MVQEMDYSIKKWILLVASYECHIHQQIKKSKLELIIFQLILNGILFQWQDFFISK